MARSRPSPERTATHRYPAVLPPKTRNGRARTRWYTTAEKAASARASCWARFKKAGGRPSLRTTGETKRVRKARRRAERYAARRQELLGSLHPEQRRAWERIAYHLERTGDSFSWRDIREAFYNQGRRCFYCKEDLGGPIPSKATFHIEHKKPVCKGGTNHPSNICIACPSCNMEKSGCDFHEYIRARRRRGLVAPSRAEEFPMRHLPKKKEKTRPKEPQVTRGSEDPWSNPKTAVFIRRRPERGKAAGGIEPLGTPALPSRKAKATGGVEIKAQQ